MNFKSLETATDGSVATITLDRPERLNALNEEMALELAEAVGLYGSDNAIRAIVLTGSGRAFCAGGDIREMTRYVHQMNDPGGFFRAPLKAIHDAAWKIIALPKPVIASLKGFVSGAGFSLALCCDFRIAAEGTKFNQAFVNIGLVPDTGSTFLLPRMLGIARAMELFCTGDFITAEQALEWGLLSRVVPSERLETETHEFAKALGRKPTMAIASIKALVYRSYGKSLEDRFELERLMQVTLSETGDFSEGLKAFVEKRTPEFKGR